MRKVYGFLLTLSFSFAAMAAPRTVFVQLFEWPWKDVAKECEIYLGPSGFSAVQVSPPHEHIVWENQPWWVRYQVVSYNLNSRSGGAEEFKDMVQRCKNAGVDIYVDAVINHTTGIPGGTGIGGTKFSHYDYPGLYGHDDFHHCGRNGNDDIKNYNDRYETQNCELLDLADLATEKDYVQEKLAEYLNGLLDLGVAGFRIDAAKHIPAKDLEKILGRLKRSAYIYSEVIESAQEPVKASEYLGVGDVMAYNYSTTLANGFRSKNTEALRHAADSFPVSTSSVVFLTNHDLERMGTGALSYNGPENRLYRLAQVFMLAWPYGYPHLYSGFSYTDKEAGPPIDGNLRTLPVIDDNNQCKPPWTCEHRLPEVAAMLHFRNSTDDAFSVNDWWSNGGDVLSFNRGKKGFVAINFSDSAFEGNFPTTLADGTYCNLMSNDFDVKTKSCPSGYSVKNGKIEIKMPPNSAFALVAQSTAQKVKKK